MRRLGTIVACIVILAMLFPTGAAFGSTQAAPNAGVNTAPSATLAAAADARFFSETGFRIDNDKFWDYFQKRGGIRTFGYPVSRQFTLMGTTVQFFQRRILQIQGDGVGQLNLFDSQFFPYTKVNGSTLPATDEAMAKAAPAAGSANYATDIVNFVKTYAPDTFGGNTVNFYQTFANAVKYGEAFPKNDGPTALMPLVNLEMWGTPTSAPMADPANANFVYQRFQRGVMHYDKTTGLTQGLLLADYFKSIITGANLPVDLAQDAVNSPFYKQYNNAAANGLNRPDALANTNMKDAFEQQQPASGTTTPTPTTTTSTTGLRYGMQADFLNADKSKTVSMTTGAGFGWIKQQIRWADIEGSRGNINWGGMDEIVNAAQAGGVKLLFSVVTSPGWSRADGRSDGPPDNYADFGNFVGQLAARYKGRVQAYEIWNEQNFSREWGGGQINAGQYVELLKAAYPKIKAADPNAVVISGALTPTGVNSVSLAVDDELFLDQMYAYHNGEIKSYCDAIGAHAAGFLNGPDDWMGSSTTGATGYNNHGSFFFKRIDQLHNVMAKYGDTKQMWITEYHWASATAPVPAGYEWTTFLSESQAATFMVQGFQMMQQRPWVGAAFVWNLNWRTFSDPHTNECAIFGILNSDWSPRPIYSALAAMPKPNAQ